MHFKKRAVCKRVGGSTIRRPARLEWRLLGVEKVRRPAELPQAPTKAQPEVELPLRDVARLPTSHPLAVPPRARQAVVLPAAHWGRAVHPEAMLLAAAPLKAVPAAARQPAVHPKAARAAVPLEVAHPPAALPAVVPPAADRREQNSESDKRVALRLSLLG